MKNNKTLKAVVLTAIVTTIIVGGLGVTAVTLTAKNVIFNSTNENLKATNVEDAINELYVLGNNKLPESYNTGYNIGYDAGILFADGRENKESANYLAGYNAGLAAGKASVSGTATAKIVKSYNNNGSSSYTLSVTALGSSNQISYVLGDNDNSTKTVSVNFKGK